jgi:hypothetical protein
LKRIAWPWFLHQAIQFRSVSSGAKVKPQYTIITIHIWCHKRGGMTSETEHRR